MLRLFHSLPYKLLSKRCFISGCDHRKSPGRKSGESLLQLGRQARGKRATVEFPPGLRPVCGSGRLMCLNLGNFPCATLDQLGVGDAKAVRTDDDFS